MSPDPISHVRKPSHEAKIMALVSRGLRKEPEIFSFKWKVMMSQREETVRAQSECWSVATMPTF